MGGQAPASSGRAPSPRTDSHVCRASRRGGRSLERFGRSSAEAQAGANVLATVFLAKRGLVARQHAIRVQISSGEGDLALHPVPVELAATIMQADAG